MSIETDEERFRRVATIFEAAGFLHTLGIRLDRVGPPYAERPAVTRSAGL